MEWTDAATQELNATLDRLRTSLAGGEVDVEEVVSDIRTRMEIELETAGIATAENIRSAALKIGIGDIVAEPPDPQKRAFVLGLEKPRRIRARLSASWFWFAGIILPLLALGTELVTHICLEAGIADPLPTPFHALLIALVPAANILGWRAMRRPKPIPIKWLGFLLGAATAVAAYHTLLFITITPFAFLGFAAIIYFGIGLLSFLPLAPMLSFFTVLRMRTLIKRNLLPDGIRRIPLYRTGLLAGLAALLLASSSLYLTKAGLSMAASENPKTQAKGLSLLRSFGDKSILNRACYWTTGMPSDPVSWLINRGRQIGPDEARDIYYRVTGNAFNTVASPTLGLRNRRNPGGEFDWDSEQGGDVVAGRLKGLALTDSRIDGTLDADAATAYLEWTMVFRNDRRTEREARTQIALPPGAAVSRLTLWIDGEEREAAFGGRSQVKQAYKKVVRRKRDPVLVTTCGPDRVLMQCYPVPANGEMKTRIGMTVPLQTPSKTGRTLRLPHMLERNFRIPDKVRHAVWIENHLVEDLTDAQLNAPATTIRAESSALACWAQDDGQAVFQQIAASTAHVPDHLFFVIDGSACMRNHLEEIAVSMDDLPPGIPHTIWVANDAATMIDPSEIRGIKARGGMENGIALRTALTQSTDGEKTCVVWIHGPQDWALDSGEKLRQVLERNKKVCLFDFQVGHGPHRLVEKMDGLTGFQTVSRTGSIKEDLERLLLSFSADSTVWKAVRTSVKQGDPAMHQANSHLVRLYALDRIRAELASGKPGKKEALQLALKYHLVTPISGAVVLETQQQYNESDLKPVDSTNVPSVPEPGTLILFMLAALLVFHGRRIAVRIRYALGG